MRAPYYSTDANEILSPAVIADPQPFYARLRKTQPLSRIGETGAHLVLSWALVEEALAREEDFSANLTGVVIRGHDGQPGIFDLRGTGANQVIATADEPDHTVHRALLQPRLTPARIERMEPLIRRWIDAALAPWLANRGGDFAPIAERIPALAIAHLLGLPERDVESFRTWAMMGGDMLAGDADIARLVFLREETARMFVYLDEHLGRADPRTADEPDGDPDGRPRPRRRRGPHRPGDCRRHLDRALRRRRRVDRGADRLLPAPPRREPGARRHAPRDRRP